MGPLEHFDDEPAFPFLGQANDDNSATRFHDPLAFAEHNRDFGRIEQLQGEAHENRVHNFGRKRQLRGISALQLHTIREAVVLQPVLGDPHHFLGQVDSEDVARRTDRTCDR
ncbi:MAG: hypothetical protein HY000_14975 [Planctomycetes bacterium]|nr:hypothetical protein [Planctomycetota bacterium]